MRSPPPAHCSIKISCGERMPERFVYFVNHELTLKVMAVNSPSGLNW